MMIFCTLPGAKKTKKIAAHNRMRRGLDKIDFVKIGVREKILAPYRMRRGLDKKTVKKMFKKKICCPYRMRRGLDKKIFDENWKRRQKN
jgi:hypothetical protein